MLTEILCLLEPLHAGGQILKSLDAVEGAVCKAIDRP